MNHPPILLVRSAQEQALCYQIVDSLGDLRLGESTQERDIPGSIIGGIIGQEKQYINLAHGQTGLLHHGRELAGIKFLKLLGEL